MSTSPGQSPAVPSDRAPTIDSMTQDEGSRHLLETLLALGRIAARVVEREQRAAAQSSERRADG